MKHLVNCLKFILQSFKCFRYRDTFWTVALPKHLFRYVTISVTLTLKIFFKGHFFKTLEW